MSTFQFLPTSHLTQSDVKIPQSCRAFSEPRQALEDKLLSNFPKHFLQSFGSWKILVLYCGYWVLILMKQTFLLSERIPLVLRKVLPIFIIPKCSSLWLCSWWDNRKGGDKCVFLKKLAVTLKILCKKNDSPLCSSVLFY